MRCALLFAFLLSFVSTFATLATEIDSDHLNTLEPRRHPRLKCAPKGVHIIAAPGQTEGYNRNAGLLQSLIDGIMQRIPHSNYDLAKYPADRSTGLIVTKFGAKYLRHYIRRYTNACPQTKIVLLGYSAGGVVNMNALCGQSAPYNATSPMRRHITRNIIANIVYGEQTRTIGASYNAGTCVNGAGRFPRSNTAACQPWADATESYCDYQDPQCCTNGADQNQHYVYATEYNNAAIDFVMKRYQNS